MEHREEGKAAVVDARAGQASVTVMEKKTQIKQGIDSSLTVIQSKMTAFNRLFGEFCDLNNSVKEIYHHL